ncbi:serine hydrolase domain-containing protein [Natronoglomus mannanivorans]|uniref:Beta-lactamase family protein n=1 Tax=Natronoglomus mannanivorans TaxID=2979990 RepID=A0AAP2Z560_9EURY|nr:beta-lactamase family protein [Halobacteria archaeon AArc-xg1-1]
MRTVPDDIESRVEKLVLESLDEYDIPGAAVAVVRDGEVTMAEGYGEADAEEGLPVEPTTPFRVGSVSKPVFWTAIARLLRRGELDDDVPVSEYLDDNFVSWDDPVTLAQLATHTGGFESTNRNMWYDNPADGRSLPEHLDPMPAQTRSPGTVGQYSNHGVALAGQVLASVVGSSFPDAMDELLLEPAGMETASFHQPLPTDLYEAHASGHGGDRDGKFAGLGTAPAGALSASAADMARFMQLHLDDGRIDGEQVLDPDTVELIQQQWFTHHEELAGMALGFAEAYYGAYRIIRHAGGTPLDAFWTELRLVPELGFGLFLSYNDDSGQDPVIEIPETIIEEVLPEPDVTAPESDGRPTLADELEGTYRSLRRGAHEVDSIFLTLNADTIDVSIADDGALLLEDGDDTTRLVETSPLVFQDVETGEKVAFGEEDGEIAYLFMSGSPDAYECISSLESIQFHLLVLAVSLLGTGSGWLHWSPSRDDGESRREWFQSLRTDQRRRARFAAHLVGSAFSLFVVLFLVYLSFDFEGTFTEPSFLFRLLFVLPLVGAVAAVAALVLSVRVWQEAYWQLRTRVHYSFVVLSGLLVTGFLWYWNLLLPP